MPRYCQVCILPETRPGVRLDDAGVCAACRIARNRPSVDWDERAAAFRGVVANAKRRGHGHDCVIPVSGGKDSYWQVVTCLEHGLHPLCVTYVYPGRTAHGEANARKMALLGVDHIEYRVNPRVERLFIEKAFRRVGIPGLVTHMGIFSVPINLAVRFDIPLVIYGENTAIEYGTEDDTLVGAHLDDRWFETFGVTA
ncbi:MAG: N-acetyl sugar amidotransferase, partial [Acidobacteriota bacterium]|nr:N-acetyl sugar amidotransferase [Acidobacteriota bacterium]